MSTASVSPEQNTRHVAGGVLARVAQICVMFALIGGLLFGGAGTLDLTWGWVYVAIYVASVLVNAWFLRRNPELVAERGRPGATRDWDKKIAGLWAVAQFMALPLVAGLDIRFEWTGSVDLVWHLAGAVLFAAGLGLFSWAMIANAYFSTAARIQPERGQTVCRNGPYRFVRHPGYVGAIIQSLAGPLALGSIWALAPGVVAAILMVIRTRLEDRMLLGELAGYTDYARDVPYRLMPGVW